MSEIPFQYKNRRSILSGYVPEASGLKDGQIFIQQADKKIFFKNDLGELVSIDPSSYVTTGQTGSFAGNSVINIDTGNFVTNSQTGNFITSSQTGSFGNNIDTGNFVSKNQTGSFVTTDQTGTFAAAAGTGSFVTTSQTGMFALATKTGSFVTTSQTGNLVDNQSLSSCLTNFQDKAGLEICLSNYADKVGLGFCLNDYLLKNQTGNFVTNISLSNCLISYADKVSLNSCFSQYTLKSETGSIVQNYVSKNDTGSFINSPCLTNSLTNYALNSSLSNYTLHSETGNFAPKNQTGNFVTCTQTGTLTACFASLFNGYLNTNQIPQIIGDVNISAGTNISTVSALNGYPLSNQTPVIGQMMQFDGGSWVPGSIPAGGNGGGGLVYYFNDSVAADLPTTNLPTSLSGTFELGRTGVLNQYTITSAHLSQSQYDPLIGFVTDVLDPDVTAIPAGLFDFNIWASTSSASQTIVQLKIYKYNGSTTTATLLATSDDVYMYDGTTVAQYVMSVVLPQTTILATDRLFVLISAKGLGNNKTVTLYFGGNTPSHVHTTIPSVGGSGVVKVINGIMQNPASKIFDSDIDPTAAISASKIQSGIFALSSQTGNFVTTGQTGAFAAAAGTGSFVTTSQTGQFVFTGNTGSHITTGQTGAFAAAAGTGSFVTTGQTGAFALAAGTGSFVTTSQTGSFGQSNTSVLTVTGTGYNINYSNYNSIIRYNSNVSSIFNIPLNITGFPIGGSVLVAQVGTGQAFFTGDAGVTLLVNGSRSRTSAKGATMTFTYTAVNEWLFNGDII
jgi:hypothetical protein